LQILGYPKVTSNEIAMRKSLVGDETRGASAMYANRRNVKSNCLKVSLNDVQKFDLEAEANRQGYQPSAFIRKLAMERLSEKYELNEDGSLTKKVTDN
jgi:hypothetical protein